MKSQLLYNALVINEGTSFTGSVLIGSGLIQAVFKGPVPESVLNNSDVLDVSNKWLMPGVIDDHVHFREPGLTHKADMATESLAALAGGVTSFMDMPNTVPQTTTIQAWEEKMNLAASKSLANYAFYLGATNENLSEIRKADFNRICGVKVFLGSSTGNMLVDNEKTLGNIFRSVPALVAVHAESEDIIQANKQAYLKQAGGVLSVRFHPLIRSSEACYASAARAVDLASQYQTNLHLLHVSTARELALFENKPLSDKQITAEVCVSHLWFDDTAYDWQGNAIKCNPAIKTTEDRTALRNAVASGLIDIIATDHAPHLWSEKQGDYLKAASGCPSIQFSLLLMLDLAAQGLFTKETVVGRMCHAPAIRFRIDRRGFIRQGYHADLVIINPDISWTLSENQILSKCAWSPFVNQCFHHAIYQTYLNGRLVVDNGVYTGVRASENLQFLSSNT